MNIYTSETEFLKAELQRLRALVRAQQITIDKLEAQSEQEPVEWGVDWGKDGNSVSIIKRLADGNIEVLAWEYAPHPPQRNPLTDEEIRDAVRESDLDWHQGWTLDDDEPNRFISLARAIEAAHFIKENT